MAPKGEREKSTSTELKSFTKYNDAEENERNNAKEFNYVELEPDFDYMTNFSKKVKKDESSRKTNESPAIPNNDRSKARDYDVWKKNRKQTMTVIENVRKKMKKGESSGKSNESPAMPHSKLNKLSSFRPSSGMIVLGNDKSPRKNVAMNSLPLTPGGRSANTEAVASKSLISYSEISAMPNYDRFKEREYDDWNENRNHTGTVLGNIRKKMKKDESFGKSNESPAIPNYDRFKEREYDVWNETRSHTRTVLGNGSNIIELDDSDIAYGRRNLYSDIFGESSSEESDTNKS